MANSMNLNKKQPALWGGEPIFSGPKPTSNLVKPSEETFFQYAYRIFDKKRSFTRGELVSELEGRLKILHNVEYCITFNSGFWALAALIDSGVLKGKKEVVLPSLTYRRMGDIISWVGLIPHFSDINRETLAIDSQSARKCINDNTGLIIGVHPVGGHCDIDGLLRLSEETGVPVIFDGVESVDEKHKGKKIGSFGAGELFSLGASKLVNGFEGGYITTNDQRLAMELQKIRSGDQSLADLRVMKAELNEVHAAMTLAGLDDLEQQLNRNRNRYNAYKRHLACVEGLELFPHIEENDPSYKNIVVEVTEAWPYTREETIQLLNAENILARAYYYPPLTQTNISYSYKSSSMTSTDYVAGHFISMPCGHFVDLGDIQVIIDYLKYLKENASDFKKKLQRGGTP
ncbi:MAG: DegT/DnrJ/EryC1/StrS family aminotransferase [Leptospirales bacterium]